MNGTFIRTFLGANSASGFASLYDAFTEEHRTLVIKGGPGSGKSGIMKKIAAEAGKRGLFVEYCHCSSDADSLDGILIPEKDLCVVDGTPPHVSEPKFPGAKDELIYTGQFWDSEKLRDSLEEIRDLSGKIRGCFGRAYRYLAAAGKAAEEIRSTTNKLTDHKKIQAFATDLTERNTKNLHKKGTVHPRFLSGIAPQGLIVNRDTVYTLAEKIYVLNDPYRIGQSFLDAAIESALVRGQTVYVFYDPLCPSIPEHIALPDAGIGFVTSNKVHPFEAQNAYQIHLSRFSEIDKTAKEYCRNAEKLLDSCTKEAIQSLQREKAYHDDLEEYYVEAMDFKKLNSYTEKIIRRIFA